jgi:HSP20 family protein
MTSLIKWEPIEDLKAVGDLLNRVLIRPWVNVSIPGLRSMQLLGVRQPVDMYETDEAFVAELDVPGTDVESLSVVVSGTKVTVTGERCVPGDCEEGKERSDIRPSDARPTYVRRERPRGRFSRKLTVPVGVEVDQITARLRNGVLVLSMPKKAKPDVVQVVPKATGRARGEAPPAGAAQEGTPAGEG